MIIVKLMGGLGNQLFQYAFGRAISLKNGQKLKFDTVAYSEDGKKMFATPREYKLNHFNITDFKLVVKNNLRKPDDISSNSVIGLIWNKIKKLNYIKEPSFNFHNEIITVSGDCYFEGYWQTEKYFKNIESLIRNEITLKSEFSIEKLEITNKIKNSNSVSVHVRRGDYVSSESANKFHGVCSLEYYEKAVELMNQKVENPQFFIFSDDINWAKNNLKVSKDAVYVSDGILRDYQELILMSYCKHNIIANSSFSWWGAWLNAHKAKIVIAPSRWFADEIVNTEDFIPNNWHKIKI